MAQLAGVRWLLVSLAGRGGPPRSATTIYVSCWEYYTLAAAIRACALLPLLPNKAG